MTLANATIILKVGLQGLAAQSMMEAKLVAAALAMREEAVFVPIMMLELGFDKSFGSMPLYIDNTSALHIAGNRTYIPRAKKIALRYYFFVQKLVGGKISVHYVVKSEDKLAGMGTKHHIKHRRRDLIKLINEFKVKTSTSLSTTKGKPSCFCARNTCVLLTISACSVIASHGRSN